MKKTLVIFSLFTALWFINFHTFAQCTPGDSISCPDPENNGEVCPAVLPTIYDGVEYSQQFTVLAPPEFDTLGTVVPLHHITLLDVMNLPQGIEWQSNAPNNEFFTGTYYCVLLSGLTNANAGNYPLKIVVDIYASILGTPVKLATVEDSTSISVDVALNPNSIFENRANDENIAVWPLPFTNEFNVQLKTYSGGEALVEIYNMLGSNVLHQAVECSE